MAVKVVNNTIHSVKIIVYKVTESAVTWIVLKEPEGLYSFPGGAQDVQDTSLEDTAKRELHEELGLTNQAYVLQPTKITHDFMHTDTSSPRFGKKGILHIFLARYSGEEQIHLHTELVSYSWEHTAGVLEKLEHAYPYLKTVFKRAVALLDT